MKRLSCLLLFFIAINTCEAFQQASDSIKPLSIGEKVPDVLLNHIINYSKEEAKLSDFRGKLLIVDFWSTNCKPCIASFPKVQELQKQFESKLHVLAVTEESTSAVDRLMKKSVILKNLKLTMVLKDEVLDVLFPHVAEPYQVWIDQNGYVVAFTDTRHVTSGNIEKALRGEKIDYSMRKFPDFDYDKSILEEGGGRQIDSLISYSLITKIGTNKGITALLIDSMSGNIEGYQFFNATVVGLFSFAFDMNPDRIIIESPNPNKYYPPSDPGNQQEWIDNLFSYEIKAPANWRIKKMKNDLQDYFNLNATVENRLIRCLVLSRIANSRSLETKPVSNDVPFLEISGNYYHLKNNYFGVFVNLLRDASIRHHRSQVMPLLDETGYDAVTKVDMEVSAPFDDLNKVNFELKKCGLKITVEERQINVLKLQELK